MTPVCAATGVAAICSAGSGNSAAAMMQYQVNFCLSAMCRFLS